MHIPFNKPYLSPSAETYLIDSYRSSKHCGNHKWNLKCRDYLKEKFHFKEVLLVPSCTAALEMGVLLSGIERDDEVILPSYTFSSTATAILLAGAKPVFCEVDPNTMNIDPGHIVKLITKKTKLIIPIDYAGIPCDIYQINRIASENNISVFLDCAQSLNSKTSKGEFTGNSSSLAAFSFHETKNYSCGEGGALVINKNEWIDRAYIMQEKGTDRKKVIEGLKSKYEWMDIGSSYLLSDLLASILFSQLENIDLITEARRKITNAYFSALIPYEEEGYITLPKPPKGTVLNNHAFFIILDSSLNKSKFLQRLKDLFNVNAYIGYVPLHSSVKGIKLGYKSNDLPLTEDLASRLVRLPFYTELALVNEQLEYTLSSILSVLNSIYK
tara:strand:- start:1484 stop:2638 length:1155 start_codon:yes stop_codon:yes gene_type:complete